MSPSESAIQSNRQTICRPTDWTDVAKFFLLNYGLHALTVLSSPGSGTVLMITNAVAAILLPFSGILTAIRAVYRFAWSESDQLQTAHKAGALCMVLPTGHTTGYSNEVSLCNMTLTDVAQASRLSFAHKSAWSAPSTYTRSSRPAQSVAIRFRYRDHCTVLEYNAVRPRAAPTLSAT